MARVLVSDRIDQAGLDRLAVYGHDVRFEPGMSRDDLLASIAEYDALIVRSETQVTAEVIAHGERLQVVGRAGVGVDNIHLGAATQFGVAVVNAPTGNTVAAAEHTMALLLSLARSVPQAHQSLSAGEWKRSNYMGVELQDKVLGIIGLGKVGSEVARRARGFRMNILGFDPYVTPEHARSLNAELADMDRLLEESDFITIHTPLSAGTRELIGAPQFAKLKPGVRLINAARGGLIDEALLDEAIREGKVAGAALDVFSSEPPDPSLPLLSNPKIIVTPHLGASTLEAQVQVAVEVVDEVHAVLSGGAARYTVNIPAIPVEVREAIGPFVPVADMMGRIAIQLIEGQLEAVTLRVSGEIARYDASLLGSAALAGILSVTLEERINLVNARQVAQQSGLHIDEVVDPEQEQYTNLVGVEVRSSAGRVYVGGSSINNAVHLLRLNDFYLDMQPSTPYMLFTTHHDQPGMIGKVGVISGNHDLNIGFMEVGRTGPRGDATMIVGYDDLVTDAVLEEIRAIDGIATSTLVRL